MTAAPMNEPLPSKIFDFDLDRLDLDAFAANGFVAVDRVTTDEELEWLRGVYTQLLARPASGFLDGVFDLSRPYGTLDAPMLGQLLMPERYIQAFTRTNMYRNSLAIAAHLLGMKASELEAWSHLIFKAPFSDAQTPWHQDEAYWDVHLRYRTVASWMPLDDVDVDNGCLWYVPGSQHNAVLSHRHAGGDPSVHVLEINETVDVSGAVPVPLPAGGMVFHHPRCLHHSGGNSLNTMRRAWGLAFQSTPVKRDKPVDHPWWYEGRQAHADGLAERKKST
ncbi:MAG: phytanoyl-CoA dioxygenase family protein [Proteobacteria bacterium]|nr:phytanoyl-CoA dioxygenase family protein [Pseudomonadota bacterium]